MQTRVIGIVIGAAMFWEAVALGQPSREALETLRLPPAKGYQVDRLFDMDRFETGENWLEMPIANYGAPGGGSSDPNNFAYVRVRLRGRPGKIYVSSGWDYNGTPIAPPKLRPDGEWGDSCAHSHHVSALFWKGEFPGLRRYFRIGSNSQLGMRMNSNNTEEEYAIPHSTFRCAVTSQPSRFNPGLNIYRWGEEEHTVPSNAFMRELILVAQSPTHGTGGCGAFQCFAPVYVLMAQVE